METRLRQLEYVKNPNALQEDLKTDCYNLLGHSFIVFHETTKGEVPVPILLAQDDAKGATPKIKIANFSLNAAALSFKGAIAGASKEPEND